MREALAALVAGDGFLSHNMHAYLHQLRVGKPAVKARGVGVRAGGAAGGRGMEGTWGDGGDLEAYVEKVGVVAGEKYTTDGTTPISTHPRVHTHREGVEKGEGEGEAREEGRRGFAEGEESLGEGGGGGCIAIEKGEFIQILLLDFAML